MPNDPCSDGGNEAESISRRTMLRLAGGGLAALMLGSRDALGQDVAAVPFAIGTGIHDITDPAIGLGMQGFADTRQKTAGVESRLYSRAFIIESASTRKRVVLVCAEVWTGTQAVKEAVLARLQKQYGKSIYTDANVMISGTHTHSGPGGFSHYYLYNHSVGGFDDHNFETIVTGIVASIRKAHANMGPGRIFINSGTVADCGMNRSMPAYTNNPPEEREGKPTTDAEMLLLKFVRTDASGGAGKPIGVLDWYAIHPADRGQKNTMVCGDNKGYASALFERAMGTDYSAKETFIAAFANANAGDVSGNVKYHGIPDGVHDAEHMRDYGAKQQRAAKMIFDSAREELTGEVDFRHRYVDMSNVSIASARLAPRKGGAAPRFPSMARTWPAALGLSFTAGSREDGDSGTSFAEGITTKNLSVGDRIVTGIAGWAAYFAYHPGVPGSGMDALAQNRFAQLLGTNPSSRTYPGIDAGQAPKPIVMALGLANRNTEYYPDAPSVLPLQMIQIGSLRIVAVPGEVTTMAGRRLRATIADQFDEPVHVALAAYSNAYSQYITTFEEYQMQNYEGASTLFGPYTLDAYRQEFAELAAALRTRRTVSSTVAPPPRSRRKLRRITIRNDSRYPLPARFFKSNDTIEAITLPNGTLALPPNSDVAFIVPEDVPLVKVVIAGRTRVNAGVGQLVTVTASSPVAAVGRVTPFTPRNA